MNTIEQARWMAKRLRDFDKDDNNQTAMVNAADTIDALIAENATQRKVLEQSLEVIKYIGYVPWADGSHPIEKAITAIQEVLK